MAKRKVSVPKEETKREKFKRVVEPRVSKAMKAIRLVGNCAMASYEYTPQDVSNILASLRETIDRLESRYSSKAVAGDDFNLD